MDTQHTSFIQPQFLISHYQFLLIMQPFRKTTTVREVLLTAGAFLLCVCACVCVCQEQERILTHERSLFLEEADLQPAVRLAPVSG